MSKLPEPDQKDQIKSFQKVFDLASKKLGGHLDKHSADAYYKAVHVFDPQQLAVVGHDMTDFDVTSGLENPSAELHQE